jgi:hypothetical protein
MGIDFHMDFSPPIFDQKIRYGDRIFLMGSCFTTHMHDRFHTHKFDVLQNPHGILFNPISIFNSIDRYVDGKHIEEEELFFDQGLWHHWDFHSQFSHESRQTATQTMNEQMQKGKIFLQHTNWMFITMGSAFVYRFQDERVVANCHKIPSEQFKRTLLDPAAIVDLFFASLQKLKTINQDIKIVLTVSPVRHLRDGFIENNRSKAVLLHAIDLICQSEPSVYYFPSYELIIDDLRDYRFYAEDMVHPNYLATQYVWDKFVHACIDGKTQEAMKEIAQLQQAMKHRPLHPHSSEHVKFRHKYLEKAVELSQRFPHINFSEEISFFS